MRGRKRLASALSQEFLHDFLNDKLAKARRTRRVASDLTQTLRTLAAAPTSMSALPPQATAPTPDIAAPPTTPRVTGSWGRYAASLF